MEWYRQGCAGLLDEGAKAAARVGVASRRYE